MTEAQQYEAAYNAHERAEQAMVSALVEFLRSEVVSVDALAVLADPSWRWDSRGALSGWIVDEASDVLNERLDALLAA